MAAAGAAWAEHRNYGYEFHGTEFSNRGNRLNLLKEISRKADLMLMLFLPVFEFAGPCAITSEGVKCHAMKLGLCCHSIACGRS